MGRFRHEEKDKTLTVYMPSNLDQAAAEEFSETSKAWLLSPITSFVLDFTGVLLISPPFYRAMVQLRDILKRAEKKHTSVGLNEKLLRQIRSDGVESAFSPAGSVTLATAVAGTAPTQKARPLDVMFINAFLTSTLKTLEVQCQTKVKVGKPYMMKEPISGIAVASLLPLASDGFTGSVLLCFPEAVFLKVYGNMCGEQMDQLQNEMHEAAGELLNIIYGQAKIDLNQKGYKFNPTLPTVLSASAFQAHQTGKHSAMVIPFETEFGSFHLEIEFGTDSKR